MGSHSRLQHNPQLLRQLGVVTYQQRWPWIGGDLQTLRDTIRPVPLPEDQGEPIRIAVPALASGAAAAGELLAFLDRPLPTPAGDPVPSKALVLALHGLGPPAALQAVGGHLGALGHVARAAVVVAEEVEALLEEEDLVALGGERVAGGGAAHARADDHGVPGLVLGVGRDPGCLRHRARR